LLHLCIGERDLLLLEEGREGDLLLLEGGEEDKGDLLLLEGSERDLLLLERDRRRSPSPEKR
jgi:hypothetical protein